MMSKNIEKSAAKSYYLKRTFRSGEANMKEKLMEEERKIRRLRFIVDLAQAVLMQQHDLTLKEAFEIMRDIFPTKYL
jgi:AmiR/NasT family two-component response regulator